MGDARRGLALAVATMLATPACVDPASTVCEDGSICPPGLECAAGGCYGPAQIAACADRADGEPCSYGDVTDGTCRDGVCVRLRCGDGVIDPPAEECDDGDQISGTNGCSAGCLIERCGNARPDPGETCDCGDADFSGTRPQGCAGAPNSDVDGPCKNNCALACNDGVKNAGEACDTVAPAGQACTDFGFDTGHLDCTAFCTLDFAGCMQFGWPQQSTPIIGFPRGIWVGGGTVAVITDDGAVFRHDGTSWQPPEVLAEGAALEDIWGAAPDRLFAVSDGGRVFRFDGSGWSLDVISIQQLRGVWGSSATDVWVVSNAGGIHHFDGTGWTLEAEVGFEVLLGAVWGSSADDVWAVGNLLDQGVIHHWDGASWSEVDTSSLGALPGLNAVAGTGPDDVWVVGDQQTVLHWDGTTWSIEQLGGNASLTGVWAGSGEVFAVGDEGTIQHHDDAGWIRLDSGTSALLSAIDGSATDDVWAVGNNARVLRWRGVGWAPPTTGLSDLFGIDGAAPTAVFASGVGGEVLQVGRNGGWGSLGFPGQSSLRAIWAAAADDVWVGGKGSDTDPWLARWHGGAWSSLPVVDSVVAIDGTGPADVWLAVDGGGVRHWDGAQWNSEVENSGSLVGLGVAGGGVVFAVGEQLGRRDAAGTWTMTDTIPFMADVWARSATDAVAVGEAGSIVHWDGSAWNKVISGVNATLNGVTGIGTETFAVGAAGTMLWEDGAGWMQVRTPTTETLNAVWASPGAVHAVGDSGTILRLVRSRP